MKNELGAEPAGRAGSPSDVLGGEKMKHNARTIIGRDAKGLSRVDGKLAATVARAYLELVENRGGGREGADPKVIEEAARAICKVRGHGADTLHWHSDWDTDRAGRPWPQDALLSNGKPAHYGWRIEVPYVEIIIRALGHAQLTQSNSVREAAIAECAQLADETARGEREYSSEQTVAHYIARLIRRQSLSPTDFGSVGKGEGNE